MKLIVTIILSCIFQYTSYARHIDPETRIVDGEQAEVAQFKYHVGVYVNGYPPIREDTYFCGGALITLYHVLSAAQCFKDGRRGMAFFGSVNSHDIEYGNWVFFGRVDIHEEYDNTTFENDIALIHLDHRVDTNGFYISPITIDYLPIGEGEYVVATGWGKTKYRPWSKKLQYAEMTTISNAECKKSYPQNVFKSTLCSVGKKNESLCTRDAGGPLISNRYRELRLVGIASYVTDENCDKGLPSGFVRVFDYVLWILEHIKKP